MNGDDMDIVIPGEEDEECKKDNGKQQSGKQGKRTVFGFTEDTSRQRFNLLLLSDGSKIAM